MSSEQTRSDPAQPQVEGTERDLGQVHVAKVADEKTQNAEREKGSIDIVGIISSLVTLIVGIAWPVTLLVLIALAFHHSPGWDNFFKDLHELLANRSVSKLEGSVGPKGVRLEIETQEAVYSGLTHQPEQLGGKTNRQNPAAVKELSAASVMQIAATGKPNLVAKILWVDPHPANNIGLQYAFQSLGLIVVTVQGDEGIEAAFQTAGNFDVVISNMKRDSFDKGGFKTAELVRAHHPRVPVILYSTYFQKPLTDEQLFSPVIMGTDVTRDVFTRVVAIASGQEPNSVRTSDSRL